MTPLTREDADTLHQMAAKARAENTPRSLELAALLSTTADAVWSYTERHSGYSAREMAGLRDVVGRVEPKTENFMEEESHARNR